MNTYKVLITETLQKIVDIKADTKEDALNEIINAYDSCHIVLDYNDFIDKEIIIESNRH